MRLLQGLTILMLGIFSLASKSVDAEEVKIERVRTNFTFGINYGYPFYYYNYYPYYGYYPYYYNCYYPYGFGCGCSCWGAGFGFYL